MRKNEFFQKGIVTILILTVLSLGKNILLPGVDILKADQALKHNLFLYVLSFSTGGTLTVPTIFSLGMGPYMTALMIWQILPLVNKDAMKRMSEQRKGLYQKIMTLIFALMQGFFAIRNMQSYYHGFHQQHGFLLQIILLLILVAGAFLIAWLADINMVKGIGGPMVLIIPSIISSLPTVLRSNAGHPLHLTLPAILLGTLSVLLLSWLAIYLNHAELRINIQRTGIDNDFSTSYIPIKVMPAGSMPLMFALSIFTIPQYIFLSNQHLLAHLPWLKAAFSFNSWLGIITYCILLVVLGTCFAYVNFRPSDIAKDLKESGDYIFGYTPGEKTETMLNQQLLAMNVIGNIFFILVTVVPLVIGLWYPSVTVFSFLMSSVIIVIIIFDTVMDEIHAIWERRHYHIFNTF